MGDMVGATRCRVNNDLNGFSLFDNLSSSRFRLYLPLCSAYNAVLYIIKVRYGL